MNGEHTKKESRSYSKLASVTNEEAKGTVRNQRPEWRECELKTHAAQEGTKEDLFLAHELNLH